MIKLLSDHFSMIQHYLSVILKHSMRWRQICGVDSKRCAHKIEKNTFSFKHTTTASQLIQNAAMTSIPNNQAKFGPAAQKLTPGPGPSKLYCKYNRSHRLLDKY
jgi:hypothetical protein